jgi:hypothetical protein
MPNVIYRGRQPDGYYVGEDQISRVYMGDILVFPFGYLLQLAKGTFTLTGHDANLVEFEIGVAGVGVYTLTGRAASAGYRVPFAPGSYAYSGVSVDLRKSTIMPADVGAFILTGRAVGPHYILQAAVGSYIQTGFSALRQTRFDALTGSYTLGGVAANLVRGVIMPAVAGSYVMTGLSIGPHYILQSAAGSYALTGQDAAKQIVGVGALGAYTLGGNAAGLNKSILFPADAGAYVQTGQDANLRRQVVQADVGAYTLQGRDASLIRSQLVIAQTGSYILSGTDVSFILSTPLYADVGAYAATGIDATLLKTGTSLLGDVGSFALTGAAAGLLYAPFVLADVGSYGYAGVTAILRPSRLVLGATGAHVLSGQAATLTYQPVKAASGSFTTGTAGAGTTLVVSGLGFQPKAIILMASGRTVVGSGGSNYMHSWGWATSPTQRGSLGTFSQDGGTTSSTSSWVKDDACLDSRLAGFGLLDLQSMDAGGFTLAVDEAFSTSYLIEYLAIGGDGVQAKAGSFLLPTALGNADFTDPGFTPDAVLIMSNAQATANTAGVAICMLGAIVSGNQAAIFNSSQHNLGTSNTASYSRVGDEAFVYSNDFVSTNRRASGSIISGGFRMNVLEAPGANVYCSYLALRGIRVALGEITTQTNTSNFALTGFGFKPKAALFVGHALAEAAADTLQVGAGFSLGIATGPAARACVGGTDIDNAATMQCNSFHAQDGVYINMSAADAVEGKMDLVSFDDDGMTLVMSDADPSATMVWTLAIGG